MFQNLGVIVLTQNNNYSREILRILDGLGEYRPAAFLMNDFYGNIDRQTPQVADNDIAFIDFSGSGASSPDVEDRIKQLLNINPSILIVATVDQGDRKTAIEALVHGAFHYITMPVSQPEVEAVLAKCMKFVEHNIDDKLIENSSRVLERKLNSISDLFNLRKLVDSNIILNKFFNMVIDSIISIIKCDKCSMLFLDNENGDILVQNNKNKRLFARGPATLNVIATKVPQIVENVEADGRFKSIKKKVKYKTRSFLNVPIFLNRKLVAIVNVTDKTDKSDFTVDDLEKIRGVCFHIEEFIKTNEDDFAFFLKEDNDDIIKHVNSEKKLLEKTISKLDRELFGIRRELDARKTELKTLYAMGKIFRTTFIISDLLKMIIEVVKKTMECRRVSILWLDDVHGDILVKGRIGKREREVEDMKIGRRGSVTNYIIAEGKSVLFPSENFPPSLLSQKAFNLHTQRGYKTNSFINCPIKVKNEIVSIINITDKISGQPFNVEDLNKLEFIAGQLSTTIENFKLSESLIVKERMSKELEIAHRIQSRLLPKSDIVIPNFDVTVMNFSALEMGGDYFDFVKISDRYYGLCVGDVAGKGVPASLHMMILRTLFRHLSNEKPYPEQVLKDINKNIIADLDPNTFITFLYCVYDAVEDRFTIANAGNSYPVHYSSSENVIRQIELPGILLGIEENSDYASTSVKLQSGDLLVLFTDGVFDVVNQNNEMWGEENFIETVRKNAQKSPEQCVEAVLKQISSHQGEEKQFDDMTMIVIKKK